MTARVIAVGSTEPANADSHDRIGRSLPYQPALDGLRAVAIGCVLAAHAKIPFLRGGGIGVWLFFALSGYLITTLLFRELARTGSIHRGRFYARRALRLLPALFVFVGVTTLLIFMFGDPALQSVTVHAVPSVLFYFANWYRAVLGQHLDYFTHTWSLSVEEQFYIVWPFVVALLAWMRRPKAALGFVFAGAMVILVYRALFFGDAAFAPSDIPVLQRTDTIADTILWGCALAVFFFYWPGGRLRNAVDRALNLLVWVAVALFLAALVFAKELYAAMGAGLFVIAPSVIGLASALMVGCAVTNPRAHVARLLSWGPIPWVGRISYSLYLWHFPVFGVVDSHHFRYSVAVLVEVGLSVALAAASYYLVEQPILRLRKRAVPVPVLSPAPGELAVAASTP